MIKVVLTLESTVQLVVVFGVQSSSMKDADHDASGRPFLNEVWQPSTRAELYGDESDEKIEKCFRHLEAHSRDVVDVLGRERFEIV